jgi:RimJ/RimL family protein N-acetyltransferase
VDEYALSDGRLVTVRPIRADDGDRLRASHGRLSPESRYRRFMSAKPQLSTSDARYLVDVDGRNHFALVATVAEPAGEAIVAVARFVRATEDPPAAEFAIVVSDAYQRQGLAGELVSRLSQAATERGVERFRATLFADNLAIQRLIERLAAGPVQRRRLGPVVEVEFDLPGPVSVHGDGHSSTPAMIAVCAGS